MAFKSLSDVGGTVLINDSRQITPQMGGDPVYGKHQDNASGVPTKYRDRLFDPTNTTTGVNIGDKWIHAGEFYSSSSSVNLSTTDARASNPYQRTYHRKIYITRLNYTAANSTDYLTFRFRFISGTYATSYVYTTEYIHYTSVQTSRSTGSSVIYPLGSSTTLSTLSNGITGGSTVRYCNGAEINIMGQSYRNDRDTTGERAKYTTVDWHIGYEDSRCDNLSNASRIYRNVARGYGHNKTTIGEVSQLEIATVSGSTVTAGGHYFDYSRSER